MSKKYDVKLKLKSGAEWVEDVWAEYMDDAALKAVKAVEALGFPVSHVMEVDGVVPLERQYRKLGKSA